MNVNPVQQEIPGRPYKVILVEPEMQLRLSLENLVQQDSELVLSGSYGTGFEVVAAMNQELPDLLIAGVPLPGIDLFRTLTQMPVIPEVIFVANDGCFATQAFEISATDYVTKPVDPQRFHRAVSRGKTRVLQQRNCDHETGSLSFCVHKLTLSTRRSVLFLKEEELDWAEAYGKHVRLHCGNESLLLKMSISTLEAILKPLNFIRIHRSVIVNQDRIRWLHRAPNRKNYQIVLKNGTSLVVTRKDALRSLLSSDKLTPA